MVDRSLRKDRVFFFGPTTTVSTFELLHPPDGTNSASDLAPSSTRLVKGSERRFAIDSCGTIQLCTPSYFREDGESLIWDMQEGYVSRDPRFEERNDDATDLEKQPHFDSQMARSNRLARHMNGVSISTLRVSESERSYFEYGDNCLVWCASVEPLDDRMWDSWRHSLDPNYDHASTILDPHAFAAALGAMAFQQKNLLGSTLAFRHPYTGYVAECRTLPVVYGPVVYVEDRKAYIQQSTRDVEFVLRCIFAKTAEHQSQREFRFAILADAEINANTLLLDSTPELDSAIRPEDEGLDDDFRFGMDFRMCAPAPEIRRCFANERLWAGGSKSANSALWTQIRPVLTLKGRLHSDITTSRRVVRNVDTVDIEAIEREIENERTWPGDARIVKCVLDGGSGNTVTIYDLGGITGRYRLSIQNGDAHVVGRDSTRVSGEDTFRLIFNDFDLESFDSGNDNRLNLKATVVNPGVTFSFEAAAYDSSDDYSGEAFAEARDRSVTVNAVSADGTAKSSFQVIVGHAIRFGT